MARDRVKYTDLSSQKNERTITTAFLEQLYRGDLITAVLLFSTFLFLFAVTNHSIAHLASTHNHLLTKILCLSQIMCQYRHAEKKNKNQPKQLGRLQNDGHTWLPSKWGSSVIRNTSCDMRTCAAVPPWAKIATHQSQLIPFPGKSKLVTLKQNTHHSNTACAFCFCCSWSYC